jgi:hypothetical protein
MLLTNVAEKKREYAWIPSITSFSEHIENQ